jgi:hypothetical protein
MARGFVYLVAIIDWYSRMALSWWLSNTMDASFCVDALDEALRRYGTPEIFNTDQGSQFTDGNFIAALDRAGVQISMDGKGCWRDNVFVERLWRSVKYEGGVSARVQRRAAGAARDRRLLRLFQRRAPPPISRIQRPVGGVLRIDGRQLRDCGLSNHNIKSRPTAPDNKNSSPARAAAHPNAIAPSAASSPRIGRFRMTWTIAATPISTGMTPARTGKTQKNLCTMSIERVSAKPQAGEPTSRTMASANARRDILDTDNASDWPTSLRYHEFRAASPQRPRWWTGATKSDRDETGSDETRAEPSLTMPFPWSRPSGPPL